MLIKASRVTNLTDARYFAARGASYIGFNLEEGTEGYLDPIYMKAIKEWLEGPGIVGEFGTASPAVAAEAASFLGLDAVQINAGSHLGELGDLAGTETILRLDGQSGIHVISSISESAAPFVSHFLLDFSGTENWTEILENNAAEWLDLFKKYSVFVHADFRPEHPGWLASAFGVAGISVTGGEEEKVGVKSFEELDAILDML
jgi:phosphoribosylanthranilate isomerase